MKLTFKYCLIWLVSKVTSTTIGSCLSCFKYHVLMMFQIHVFFWIHIGEQNITFTRSYTLILTVTDGFPDLKHHFALALGLWLQCIVKVKRKYAPTTQYTTISNVFLDREPIVYELQNIFIIYICIYVFT